jgi:hypothetical protein
MQSTPDRLTDLFYQWAKDREETQRVVRQCGGDVLDLANALQIRVFESYLSDASDGTITMDTEVGEIIIDSLCWAVDLEQVATRLLRREAKEEALGYP